MSTTRTQFTFRVDTWTPDRESIVEHVAVSRTLAGASHGGRNPPDRGERGDVFAIRVARKLKAIDVIDVLSDLFILQGIPAYIRSDNGPEFLAKAVQEWVAVVGAKTAYIERGSPWENGYIALRSK